MSVFKFKFIDGQKTSRRARTNERKRRNLRIELLEDRRVFAGNVLDPTFGTGGYIRADFGNTTDFAQTSALDSENRIVAVGWSTSLSENTGSMAVESFQPNGNLDTSFGTNGKLSIQFGSGTDDAAFGLSIMEDGRILIVGSSQTIGSGDAGDMAVVRLTENGQFDTTFNGSGKQTISITASPSSGDVAKAVFVTTDGSILLAGEAYNEVSSVDYVVVKLTSSGALDESFASGGKQVFDLGQNDNDSMAAAAIQEDGKMVLVGYSGNSLGFKIARVNEDGPLDTLFGSSGVLNLTFRPEATLEHARSVAVQNNGNILVVGASTSATNAAVVVTRLTSDGELDLQFNNTGKQIVEYTYDGGTALIDFGSSEYAIDMVAQTDGKIVVLGGTFVSGAGNVVCLARLNSDGTLDTSFDLDGKRTVNTSGFQEFANSMSRQSNGKIIVTNTSPFTSDQTAVVTRLNGDGSLDSTFGIGGSQTLDITANEYGISTAVQTDDKILVVGPRKVVRLSNNGNIDTSFADGGQATILLDASYNNRFYLEGVAIQPDGKIVLSGGANKDIWEMLAVRLTANGNIDPSFGTDGIQTVAFGGGAGATAALPEASG